ncbi:MAG: F0F1 ATP synthase subunit A [Deltaproteobacteria bacterium]|nr:F0F1 ATP synthase subunit A [Deltaproteobacteria bacterium]
MAFEPLAHLLAGYGIDPVAGTNAVIVSVLLILFAFFAGYRFRREKMVEPTGKVTLSFLIEWALAGMYAFFEGIVQHPIPKLFVLLATFSFFILGNNVIGLIPGFAPPTDQFNVTITLALVIFITAHIIGIRTHGFAYVKKFLGPIWWLSPLMFPIEVVSNLVRPVSLSVRLFGNMYGDHKVVAMFGTLIALGLPIPFMGLGVLVAFLQTFIFVLLSAVYFQDALSHPH